MTSKPYNPDFHSSIVANIRAAWNHCQINAPLLLTDEEIYNLHIEGLEFQDEDSDYIKEFPQLDGSLGKEQSYAPVLYWMKQANAEKQTQGA